MTTPVPARSKAGSRQPKRSFANIPKDSPKPMVEENHEPLKRK